MLVIALLGMALSAVPAAFASKMAPSAGSGINLKIQGFDRMSKSWTPGNTGGYAETESIPFRVILTGPGTLKTLTVLADHLRDGVKGIEDLNNFQVCTGAPVAGPEGATNCNAITGVGITVTRDLPNPVSSGGVEQVSYTFRNIQIPSSGLVLKWGAELAIGSHLYNGSALHMQIGAATAADGSSISFGSKDVPIPVNQILATETDKKIDGRDAIGADNPLSLGQKVRISIVSKAVGPAKGTQTLTVKDTLPSCLRYAGNATPAPVSAPTAVNGVIPPGGEVVWVYPNIKNGTTVTSAFDAVVVSVGTCTNVATTSSDKTVVPSRDTVPITTLGKPDMSLSKDCTDTVAPGGVATCTITYQNTGDAVAKDVKIVDVLDPGLAYEPIPDQPTPSVSGTPATGQTLTWTLGDLQPGAGGTITYGERVPATGPAGTQQFKDTATAFTTGDPDPDDNKDTETVTVIYTVNMAITKACPGTIQVNTPTQESVTYSNKGTAAATGVTIVDTLPAGMTYVTGSASVAPTSYVNNVLTWEIGNVAAKSGPVTITYKVTITAPGEYKNSVTIDSDQSDGDSSDNKAECTAGSAFTDVAIGKACPSNATPGATVTHTLTFSNLGNQPASGVKIVDTLGAGLTYVPMSAKLNGSPISAAPSGQVLTFTLNTVNAGATGTITYDVKIQSTSSTSGIKTFTDTAVISTTSTNAINTANDSKACTTSVDFQPNLKLTKDGCRATVVPGGYQTYTIGYENTGSAPATGAKITDTPPANQPIAEAPGATVSGNTATWNLGTLDPGEKGTVELTVLVNAADGTQVSNTAKLEATNATATTSTEFTTVSSAGAATSGMAYGIDVRLPLIGAVPLIDEFTKAESSAPGGIGDDQAGPVPTITLLNVVNGGLLTTASHSEVGMGEASTTSSSTIANLNLLNGLIKAKAVRAVSTSVAGPFGASSNSEGSTFADLVINGQAYTGPITPGTQIKVPYLLGEATITLLAPTKSAGLENGKFVTQGSVDMIKVTLNGVLGLLDGTSVTVGHAESKATYPTGMACGKNPNTVSGHAFTAYADLPLLDPVYVNKAEITPLGGTANADAASVTGLPGTLGASALTNSATGSIGNPPTATSKSKAAAVNVLNGLVTADALDVTAHSTANGTTAETVLTSQFVNLKVAGVTVDLPVPPNFTIDVPSGGGIAHIVLNEQVVNTPSGKDTSGTVTAVHVRLFNSVGLLTSDVKVVSAHSDAHTG